MSDDARMPEKSQFTGDELFGQSLAPIPQGEETYDESDSLLIQMMLESGRLKFGGVPVEIEKLKKLRRERNSNVEADSELCELLSFVDWFRHNHCLNLLERNLDCDTE